MLYLAVGVGANELAMRRTRPAGFLIYLALKNPLHYLVADGANGFLTIFFWVHIHACTS